MNDTSSVMSLLNVATILDNCIKSKDEECGREIFSLNFKILCCIYRLESPSQSQIVSNTMLAKSNVAMLTRRLAEQGLVNTQSDQLDRRVVHYSLSEKGIKYVDDLLIRASKIFSKLPQLKMEKLRNNIQTIEKIFKEMEEERKHAEIN